MPTPPFAFRLSPATKDNLARMAKIYGAPSTSAFAREVLEVAASGEPDKVLAFNRRLIAAAGEQLNLNLAAVMGETKAKAQPKRTAKRRMKR